MRRCFRVVAGKEKQFMNRSKKVLSVLSSFWLSLITLPGGLAFATQEPTAQTPVVSAKPTQQQLQQLVAPIALYPDSLVAQILAASTYPDQVVEADRWVQANASLQGDQLAQAVDQQSWDPSVKALAEFPSVLANMDKNLSWTSSLGDAYINDQQDVMNAVQLMRQSAEKAGNLKSTPQLNVSQQGQTIFIQPADPEIVYVPEYDPWLVYGGPILAWPGWYWYPGLYWTSPGIAFGPSFGIGFFGGYGWGWHHWAPDWDHRRIDFNHSTYVSHSRTIINRNYYANRTNTIHNSVGGFRGGNAFHGETHAAPVPQHGFAAPRTGGTGHPSAFGGFNHGGVTRGYSSRGLSSFGGSHAGGFHGGGHGGGGGRH
jgi:uncharacterized membrane protein YgcG